MFKPRRANSRNRIAGLRGAEAGVRARACRRASGGRCGSIPIRSTDEVDIRVQLDGAVLQVMADRKRVMSTNTHVWVLWMIGTALILLSVAILFLRNQIRPIERLGRCGRGVRQGARRARLSAVRRDGSAARVARLPRHARAHLALRAAAHGHARRRQPRSAHAADAHEARAGDDGRQRRRSRR